MANHQFHRQLQAGISRWLKSGEKCGFVELDSQVAVLSSVLGKRSDNQDRIVFLRVKFEKPQKPSMVALVLCDGMGGMVSGSDCADLAISTFVASLVHSNASVLTEKVEVAVRDANQAVYNTFKGEGGTTLSAVVCNEINQWAAINVGDSRIYAVFNSGLIEQLTVDDTLEQQLINLNLPSPPPEFRQLIQYIGMGEELQPRKIELNKYLSEMKWFLITSDGAHNLPNDIFTTLIKKSKNPRDAVSRLIELSEWLGGRDNATAGTLLVQDNLFSNSEALESFLEIWSLPGKIQFLILKPLPTEIQENGLSTIMDYNGSKTGESIQDEEVPKNKKSPRKKNQSNIPKSESKGKKYNPKNAVTGELNKSIPQLNVEFSEEN